MVFTGLVWPVLTRMLKDAARYYKQNGMHYVARYMLLINHMLRGLPAPVDAHFSLQFAKGSLSEWKQHLYFVSGHEHKYYADVDSIYRFTMYRGREVRTGKTTSCRSKKRG